MDYSKKKLSLKNESSKSTIIELLKNILLFLGIFILLCLVLASLLSAIFYNLLNPTKYLSLVSLFSLFLSSFISAFLLSKKMKKNYIISGLFLGLTIVFVLFVGVLFTETKIFSAIFLIKLLVLPICVFGAILGGIKSKKKNKRKRHFR